MSKLDENIINIVKHKVSRDGTCYHEIVDDFVKEYKQVESISSQIQNLKKERNNIGETLQSELEGIEYKISQIQNGCNHFFSAITNTCVICGKKDKRYMSNVNRFY